MLDVLSPSAHEWSLLERNQHRTHAGYILCLLARFGVKVTEPSHMFPLCARGRFVHIVHKGFFSCPRIKATSYLISVVYNSHPPPPHKNYPLPFISMSKWEGKKIQLCLEDFLPHPNQVSPDRGGGAAGRLQEQTNYAKCWSTGVWFNQECLSLGYTNKNSSYRMPCAEIRGDA